MTKLQIIVECETTDDYNSVDYAENIITLVRILRDSIQHTKSATSNWKVKRCEINGAVTRVVETTIPLTPRYYV